jgi:HEAT repeat protein
LGGFWSFVGEKARDPDLAFLHLPPQWDKPEVSCWAMRLLGAEARPAVPALVRLLNSRYPEVRDNAAMCLAGIGPAAEEAVPALVQALRIPKGATPEREASAWFAAYALGEIGPAAGAAAAALEELTNDAALPFLRNGAAIALIKLRRGSFQTFFDRLKDTSEPSKWEHVAWAVSGLGTNADPAIPLLLAGIEHSNDVLRWAAIKAIGRIHRQPGLCLGPLASVLDSRDDTLRWLALNALGNFGPAAKPVAAEVVRCLTDRNGSVRGWATNALRLIEPDARKTVGP